MGKQEEEFYQLSLEREKIQALREEIVCLKSTIEKLKIQQVVKVEKVVEPKNYKKNMNRLRVVEKENQTLRRVLEYGNISALESLIDEYEISSKVKLKKIVQEFENHRSESFERKALNDFIIFLESVVVELKSFLD